MGERDNGGPIPPGLYAFPFSATGPGHVCPGMTLRDWFAGQALVALSADIPAATKVARQDGRSPSSTLALAAYELADAMLEAREGKG